MSPRFLGMAEATEKIYALLEPLLDGTDMFVVSIKIKPTNNIKVFIDADSGFSIEKCVSVNRRLYAEIDQEGLYPDGDFSLEVSSPGVEEPLVQLRQYRKNVGRKLLVIDNEDKETTGMLKDVTETEITLEVKKPKEKEPTAVIMPFTTIKQAIVQIIF